MSIDFTINLTFNGNQFGNADVFAVITPTEIDSDLRLSGGTTPRRLAADEDEESPRSNRFSAKGPAATAAAENKSKTAHMSRSPPRRRKQDNAISKGSRKSVMTRSPTKKDKEVAYRYDDRSRSILRFVSSGYACSFAHTCCVCRAV